LAGIVLQSDRELGSNFPGTSGGSYQSLTCALTNQNQDSIQVAMEAASALSKFASNENYLHLEHLKNIITEGGRWSTWCCWR
jgi:hypothetical protein